MYNVIVKVYDKDKYQKEARQIAEIAYTIDSYAVKQITDTDIYKLGFDTVDEHGEYLILTFETGEKSTFCNSHVDLFRKIIF